VERTPDAVAVVFEDQQLTYRELNTRANQLAHYLRKLGVGPEVLVGICVERSLEMIIGLLGILKAGGAYVPLDPDWPEQRLGSILEDTRAPVLLTHEGVVEKLLGVTGNDKHDSDGLNEPIPTIQNRQSKTGNPIVVCLNANANAIARESGENLLSGVTAENLAYVMYTSGSTGRPKGVMVCHRGLGNVAAAQGRAFHVTADSRVLQFASLSFDASVFEITMALYAGATICLGTRDALLPGLPLVQFLSEQAITIATVPPSALAALPSEKLPALRTINVAGEACAIENVARWAADRRFFNLYGPTEATIWATMAECVDASREPAIGRPIANTQAYLLDHNLEPVPIGVPGELHLSGVGLARGYLNRPEMSAEKFIPNPFSSEPGARMYKT
jgi:amino acid adenylation domain-containing protein